MKVSTGFRARATVTFAGGLLAALIGTGAAAGAPVAGSAWTVARTPVLHGAQFAQLEGVACPSSRFCVAVGWDSPPPEHLGALLPSDLQRSLIESWNGWIWSTVPHPETEPLRRGGNGEAILRSVSCASPSSCVAVGADDDRALIESWNGHIWAAVRSPSRMIEGLTSVSCISPDSCVAVGSERTRSGVVPLTESWDGRTWTSAAAPTSRGSSASLSGVTCASSTLCLFSGSTVRTTPSEDYDEPLLEKWDGRTSHFDDTPSPRLATGDGEMIGVSCASASACDAVGYSFGPIGPHGPTGAPDAPLIETWNGRRWSLASAPTTSLSNPALEGVTCPSLTGSSPSCVAVGSGSSAGGATSRVLIDDGRGAAWSVVEPRGVQATGSLDAVTCAPAAAGCVAVGTASADGSIGAALVISEIVPSRPVRSHVAVIGIVTAAVVVLLAGAASLMARRRRRPPPWDPDDHSLWAPPPPSADPPPRPFPST